MPHASLVQPARSPGSKRHCALAASCSHRLPAGAERAREPVHQANMSGGLWGPCADVCHAACPTRRRSSRPGRLAAKGTARSLHLAHVAPRPLQSARASARTRETCAEVCGARALQGAMQHAPRVAGAAGQVAWQQEALRARCILLTWPPGRCRARARARTPGKHARRSVGHVRCRVPCSMPHASPEQPARSPGSKRHCALAASCSRGPRPLQSARASACTPGKHVRRSVGPVR